MKYKIYNLRDDAYYNNSVYVNQDGDICNTNGKILQKYGEYKDLDVLYSTGYLDMNGEEIFDGDYIWLQTQRSDYFQVAKYVDNKWMLENENRTLVLSEWVHEATICHNIDIHDFVDIRDVDFSEEFRKTQESENA